MLMTHRNSNFAAAVVAIRMAAVRSQRKTPSAPYLVVGAAGVGLLAYTAYLGCKLVYKLVPALSPRP